jgi:hypothetical protein
MTIALRRVTRKRRWFNRGSVVATGLAVLLVIGLAGCGSPPKKAASSNSSATENFSPPTTIGGPNPFNPPTTTAPPPTTTTAPALPNGEAHINLAATGTGPALVEVVNGGSTSTHNGSLPYNLSVIGVPGNVSMVVEDLSGSKHANERCLLNVVGGPAVTSTGNGPFSSATCGPGGE